MRKLIFMAFAVAAILLVNFGSTASAATSTGAAIPSSARNFSPVKEAACRGFGRWCGPGFTRACNPYHCWCRPCF